MAVTSLTQLVGHCSLHRGERVHSMSHPVARNARAVPMLTLQSQVLGTVH